MTANTFVTGFLAGLLCAVVARADTLVADTG